MFILGRTDHIQQRVFIGKSLFLFVKVELSPYKLNNFQGIGRINNREIGWIANGIRIAMEQHTAIEMKGSALNLFTAFVQNVAGTPEHFLCRSSSKRKQ